MLVLTRKVGEQICVPQLDVVLTVLAVHGRKVRLGIAAPEKIAVVREELRQRSPQPGKRDSLAGAIPNGNATRPTRFSE